jgi:hypothetical protein
VPTFVPAVGVLAVDGVLVPAPIDYQLQSVDVGPTVVPTSPSAFEAGAEDVWVVG